MSSYVVRSKRDDGGGLLVKFDPTAPVKWSIDGYTWNIVTGGSSGGGGGTYVEGFGITIEDNSISVNKEVIQEKLIQGAGINLQNNTISVSTGAGLTVVNNQVKLSISDTFSVNASTNKLELATDVSEKINVSMAGETRSLQEALDLLYSYHAAIPDWLFTCTPYIGATQTTKPFHGSTVDKVVLSWNITDTKGTLITQIKISADGMEDIIITDPTDSGSRTFTELAITADKMYTATLYTSDGVSSSKEAGVLFYNKLYRGATTNIAPAASEILSMELVAGRTVAAINYTFNLSTYSEDQRVCFAYPKISGFNPLTSIMAGNPDSGLQQSLSLYALREVVLEGTTYYVYTFKNATRAAKYRIEVK